MNKIIWIASLLFSPSIPKHTIQENNICIFQVFQGITFSYAAWLHISNKSAQKLNLEYDKGRKKKYQCDLYPQNLWLPYTPWLQATFWLSCLPAIQLTKG